MIRFLFIVGLMVCLTSQAISQNIVVQPYLQDAEPDRVTISWEADAGTTGLLRWGALASNLNQSQAATFVTTVDGDRLFTASATGLEADTRYFYQVSSGTTFSNVFDFMSPPAIDAEQNFSLVVMSDMQKDGSQPLKFQEVVRDGVLDYFEDINGDNDIAGNLGLVMIPGDLVVNGNNHGQWQNDFFGQADLLLRHVPVYPVLGNHENNSNFYFQYFTLPENGSIGYEEHWWYKDYSNVRIIGLNSNSGFRVQEQLDWLSDVLEDACQEDHIDFVFAQLHHPFLSELWTPGELDYSGDAISLLEDFTSSCGKPSVHFFGHTHGYSRGQSRDHNHLWVNAASAGGAIDNWGEFPNQDYAEFSKSIDEYGFVVVDVTAGNDPQFSLRRISRGDQDVVVDNELQDEILIRRNEIAPLKPMGISPVGVDIDPQCVNLQATTFNDATDQHQASQWQLSTDCADFTTPVFDSWKQNENFYDEVNTQANDDLTDELVGDLTENTSYCWRVRYRDSHLKWSAWSDPLSFTTGASGLSENLLLNPGGENALVGWTINTGSIESLTAGECNGILPFSGNNYFAVGGLCDGNETAFSEAFQLVDISSFSNEIDVGNYQASFGGSLSNFNGNDRPAARLEFLDTSGNSLGQTNEITTLNSSWTSLSSTVTIPALTRSIKLILTGTRNSGTDNDAYFDELSLRLGSAVGGACQLSPLPVEILSFTAKCQNGNVDLAWEVADEQNIVEYQLEKSTTAINWTIVGQLIPDTESRPVKRYVIRDTDEAAGSTTFYRILIKEADGTSRYSKIVEISCKDIVREVIISPNPVSGNRLKLSFPNVDEGSVAVKVTDLLGRVVENKQLALGPDNQEVVLWVGDWPVGQYFIHTRQGNWSWSAKLIRAEE